MLIFPKKEQMTMQLLTDSTIQVRQEKKIRTQINVGAICFLFTYVSITFLGGLRLFAQEVEQEEARYSIDDILTLEEVLRIEPSPLEDWGGTNSYIVYPSEDIGRIALRGRSIVPSLVKIMEVPDIKFDTFVKCFLVCREVSENEKDGNCLDWTGGSQRVPRGAAGHHDFVFPSSMDPKAEEEFRSSVIVDIKNKIWPKQKEDKLGGVLQRNGETEAEQKGQALIDSTR